MYELKDYLNAINFTKQNLLDTNDDLTKKISTFRNQYVFPPL